MAGQGGEVEEFAEGEGTRQRVTVQTARHPQRPLRQVSLSRTVEMFGRRAQDFYLKVQE